MRHHERLGGVEVFFVAIAARESHEDDQLELLREGLSGLDARSRDILKRRFLGEPKATLQELADEYGVSAERIRQVEANALKKMRALFAA